MSFSMTAVDFLLISYIFQHPPLCIDGIIPSTNYYAGKEAGIKQRGGKTMKEAESDLYRRTTFFTPFFDCAEFSQ